MNRPPCSRLPLYSNTRATWSAVIPLKLEMKWTSVIFAYCFDIQLSNQHQVNPFPCSFQIAKFNEKAKGSLIYTVYVRESIFSQRDTVLEMISIQGMDCLALIPSSEHNISPFHLFVDYFVALSCSASVYSNTPPPPHLF